MLVLSAEDDSGISPVYKKINGPSYCPYYLDALVVWYTGDDVITRDPGMAPGTASRLANDELLAVRQCLDEGGRLLFTGKYAGLQYAQGYEFDLEHGLACDPNSSADGCEDLSDDLLQYYLGAYLNNEDAGTTSNGKLYDVVGRRRSVRRALVVVRRAERGQPGPQCLVHRDERDPPEVAVPAVRELAVREVRAAGRPVRPAHWLVLRVLADRGRLVQAADAHRRPDRQVRREPVLLDLARHRAGLGLRVRRGAHGRPGGLDDAGRRERAHQPEHRTQRPRPGELSGGVARPAPWLAHYQTWDGSGACTPTGTTGEWNTASGRSAGWEQWSLDLSRYAGKQVEISISYASDWSVQGLGAFVDDTTVSTGETTSFEDGLGGWTVSGPPAGSAPNSNNWTRTTAAGFPEGAAISTPWSVYLGFGVEGIATPEARNAVIGRAVGYLLR